MRTSDVQSGASDNIYTTKLETKTVLRHGLYMGHMIQRGEPPGSWLSVMISVSISLSIFRDQWVATHTLLIIRFQTKT